MRLPFEPDAYESLLEQGLELQRRHDAVLSSRTWRMQLAVARARGARVGLLRLPSELWRILRSAPAKPAAAAFDLPSPPSPLPSSKPLALALVPWLRVGGAERVVLEIIEGLGADLDFAVLPASAMGPVDPRFRQAKAWIFPPPAGDYAGQLEKLVAENAFDRILISSCPQAYAVLPSLPEGAQAFDILHNAAPEGALPLSVEHDRYLTGHFAVGAVQAGALHQAGVNPKKIFVARNGVDCQGRFHPESLKDARSDVRSRLGVPDDGLLLGWVGRLSEEKEPQLFVRTLAQLPEARGLLIGDGPERFRVEQSIRELGLSERLCVTGFTSRVPELVAACDALLLTSRIEGSPLTILEAMSLEKPVIATDVGAVSEAVDDGETGYLIRESTPEAFAAAVRKLSAHPALGPNARQRVLRDFSLTGMLDAYRAKLVP